MSIRVIIDSNEHELKAIEEIENGFVLKTEDETNKISVFFNYCLNTDETTYDEREYSLYLLKAQNMPENYIFQVHDKQLKKKQGMEELVGCSQLMHYYRMNMILMMIHTF